MDNEEISFEEISFKEISSKGFLQRDFFPHGILIQFEKQMVLSIVIHMLVEFIIHLLIVIRILKRTNGKPFYTKELYLEMNLQYVELHIPNSYNGM